jgi:hypothetical protein
MVYKARYNLLGDVIVNILDRVLMIVGFDSYKE